MGIAAAVIDSWWTFGDTSKGGVIHKCLFSSPQSYINIALFTSILEILLCSTVLAGMVILSKKAHGPTSKDILFITVMELISCILLWIFWFASIITTTILANDPCSESTMKACCAFCWLSWFSVTASLVMSILALASGRKPAAKAPPPEVSSETGTNVPPSVVTTA